jgi:tetratricopeptide (TPR) repeat protein/predicted small secreted protein
MMNKKTIVLLLLAAALFSCATADGGAGDIPSLDEAIEQSAADIAAKLPKGTRVAIAGFESPNGNLSVYIMDEIAGVLTDGSLEVADRNNLAYVYKELNLQTSGEVDDESAQAVGKFQGARYVITGQLVDTGGRYRYRLNSINVETAIHESSTRLDVRNDRRFRELSAALQKTAPALRTASYGGSSTPQTPGKFLDRGITFASRGEYDMAIADFTEAVNLDPDMQAAWMLRGRALYASVSNVISVGENFSSVSAVPIQTVVISDGPVTIISTMPTEERKAVYDRAIADFTQAIRLDPDNAKAYKERGNAYYIKGDYDRAIADYTQAIRLDPDYALAYHNRGDAYSDKDDYDRAIADYTQAIRLNPDYASAYYSRGDAYSNKDDYDRAIADYTQVIRLDPDSVSAYYSRGDAYWDKDDYDRAIADYTQAIRLDPDDASAFLWRGHIYDSKGDYDRAIADYTQTIRLDPDYVVSAYHSRGDAYINKGDYDRAIADYTQVIRLIPDNASAHSKRGIAYYNKGDYVRARTDWEKALQLNPNQANARGNLEMLRGMGY